MGVALSSQRYRSRRATQEELGPRLRELAIERARWGCWQPHVLLKREGVQANHKRIYILYCEEGLAVLRRRHKGVAVPRRTMVLPARLNGC